MVESTRANPEGLLPSIDISGIRYRPSIMLGEGFGWNCVRLLRISHVFSSIAWIDNQFTAIERSLDRTRSIPTIQKEGQSCNFE